MRRRNDPLRGRGRVHGGFGPSLRRRSERRRRGLRRRSRRRRRQMRQRRRGHLLQRARCREGPGRRARGLAASAKVRWRRRGQGRPAHAPRRDEIPNAATVTNPQDGSLLCLVTDVSALRAALTLDLHRAIPPGTRAPCLESQASAPTDLHRPFQSERAGAARPFVARRFPLAREMAVGLYPAERLRGRARAPVLPRGRARSL